ncbi:hypothetical protein APS56_15345 [Pseudalgibacter alginicilyticus]|uniref:Uncharacterized protein n=1 Tax=Pseudalgibacter alginicilyticus TaxID=1736674 RepID=A0A0P0DE61_9FLAO|nr:hypothetical protein [Pseudalgibacter alginicilyticus]ALJ06426.1 hypothetical protein APS56_15345 [Pseudalgibacter alginicilyticus]
MVLNDIKKLIEKYENGETSLKEEANLKDYFSQEKVASELEVYKPLFTHFIVNQKEQFTKAISLKSKKGGRYKWFSVAAIAVFLIGFYFTKSFNNSDLGTIKDPEIAFNKVSKSLEMISNHLNKGASTVSYLDEVENATSIIFKEQKSR